MAVGSERTGVMVAGRGDRHVWLCAAVVVAKVLVVLVLVLVLVLVVAAVVVM